jgi:hypothetical protein
VRTPTISSAFYAPGQIPADALAIGRFLFDELQKISAAINALSTGHLDKTYVAPTKPRDGDIRMADGTSWNPGSGIGVYAYYGAAWHLLG